MSQQTRKKRASQKRPRVERRSAPGAMPGTIEPHPESNKSIVHLIAYGPTDIIDKTVTDLDSIPDPDDVHPVVWVNIDGFRDVPVLEYFANRFRLHPLAMEDVVNVHQRAKVEIYENAIFVVARMMHQREHLESEQISFFLGDGFILSFQDHGGDCLEQVRARIRLAQSRIRHLGPDYLLYALLDAVIDHYFPLVDRYADQLDAIEEQIAHNQTDRVNDKLHGLRSELLLLRRAVRPHREMVGNLARDESPRISPNTRVYLRDCYDHTVQLLDLLDTYREMCGDLREFHLSVISNRMNEIMKVLTIISTIFMPLSFIAGVYGMNFDTRYPWNMPELHSAFGYPLVWAVMLGLASAMVYFFWRKGWYKSV